MKATGWAATAIGAVVLVGGGIWAATTLPAKDEPAYTGAYEPAITETPAAGEEPSKAVETPTVEPTPEVEYTEAEAELIQVTRYGLLSDLDLSDAEILEAAQAVCDERDAGLSGENLTTTVRGATNAQNVQFRIDAVGSVCVAQD